MNREKLIKNSSIDPEVSKEFKNWELFFLNMGDSLMVPDLTAKIFERRLWKAEEAAAKKRPHIKYYHFPMFPDQESEHQFQSYIQRRQTLINEVIFGDCEMTDIQVRDSSRSECI